MTIRSVALVATERDTEPTDPSGKESAPTGGGQQITDQQKASVDRLAAAVPADVIVLYTAVLGVLASSLNDDTGSYLPLRWWLYGGCLLAIVTSVPLAYRLRSKQRRRRVPVAETVTALWAFAVWGLVVPESPLYILLGPPTLPVAVGCLTAVGVYVLSGILSPLLDRPAATPRRSRDGGRRSGAGGAGAITPTSPASASGGGLPGAGGKPEPEPAPAPGAGSGSEVAPAINPSARTVI